MTRREALQVAVLRLQRAGVEGAEGDARLLLAHSLGIQIREVLFEFDTDITPAQSAAFDVTIQARQQRQPVSQIIGKRSFWMHDFKVTPDVLDPRPETEQLIEQALSEGPIRRVLDLGTGSGCILLSILAERGQATGLGTDISSKALAVAKENAATIGVESRAEFCKSNWFENVNGKFDLIVSNPPYITSDEMAELAPEVHNWEPHLALTPGGDGLASYRIIAKDLADFLELGGRAFLEAGISQIDSVVQIFTDAGFKQVSTYADLSGRARGVCIR